MTENDGFHVSHGKACTPVLSLFVDKSDFAPFSRLQ